MKHLKSTLYSFLFTIGITLITHQSSEAQTQFGNIFENDSLSALQMPIGYTRIGEQDYFGLRIQPKLRFGKLGFGLNIPILFKVNNNENENSVRNEEYQNGTGSFRLLSYLRYGQKGIDKVYARLGTVEQMRLGSGLLVNNYTNASSFERRKVGILFDVKPADMFGIEGFYSDFNGFSNLLAIRPYFRPFSASLSDIASTIEVGGVYLRDADQNRYDITGERTDTRLVKDGLSAFAIDASATVSKSETFELKLYTQYAQMNELKSLSDSIKVYIDSLNANPNSYPEIGAIRKSYNGGNGFSIGANAKIEVSKDVFQLDIRLERLFYSDHFYPQFFDAVYEIDKDAKIWQLAYASQIQGTYGALTATIMKKVSLTGALQIPDNVTDVTPALIQFQLRSNDFPIKGLMIQGNYVKGNLGNLEDAFTLDERSLLSAGIRYTALGIFMIGADYRWTFARIEEDGINTFKATTYVTPYFGLNIPLGRNRTTE